MTVELYPCDHHWVKEDRDDGSISIVCTKCDARQTTEPACPYHASPKARPDGPWYDSFMKSARITWVVFDGTRLLAEVKNEQQARNILEAIRARDASA